jgi:hypothetical protein
MDPWELAASVSFPCVLKPLALSGSRGVMRVDNGAALVTAFHRLRALLDAPDLRGEPRDTRDLALVEGFVEGREFALEALMHQGTLTLLAIFDKPDPLDGPFFEGDPLCDSVDGFCGRAARDNGAVDEAARALGCVTADSRRVSPERGRCLRARSGRASDRRSLCPRAAV